jgi:hypothetical protein
MKLAGVVDLELCANLAGCHWCLAQCCSQTHSAQVLPQLKAWARDGMLKTVEYSMATSTVHRVLVVPDGHDPEEKSRLLNERTV